MVGVSVAEVTDAVTVPMSMSMSDSMAVSVPVIVVHDNAIIAVTYATVTKATDSSIRNRLSIEIFFIVRVPDNNEARV